MENEQIKSCKAQLVIFKEQDKCLPQYVCEDAPCIIDTPNGIQMRPYCVLRRPMNCKFLPINFAIAINHDYGSNLIAIDIIRFHKAQVLEDGYILYALDTPVFALDNKRLEKSDAELFDEAIDFLRMTLGTRINSKKLDIRYL